MNNDVGFSRIWYTWKRTRAPTEFFRAGNRSAPSYDIETAIDHLVSSVNSLAGGVAEGRDWDFVDLTARRLAGVEEIAAMVEAASLGDEEKAVYQEFLDLTRSVLRAMAAR